MVEFPLDDAPQRPITHTCNHDPKICTACLQQMLIAQIDGGTWDTINCPIDGCGETLEGKDVQAFTEPETFRRYVRLANHRYFLTYNHLTCRYNTYVMNKTLSSDPDFRWCCGKSIQGAAFFGMT